MNEPTHDAPDRDTTGTKAEAQEATALSPVDRLKVEAIKATIVEVLHTCYDPEIPVDIYDLGLIYDLSVSPEGAVVVTMTLTSPMCPAAVTLPAEVESKVRKVDGVSDVKVDVVWDPPWSPDRLSEAARLRLNLF